MSTNKSNKIISFLVKLGLTLAAFWLVFAVIDVEQLRHILVEQKHSDLWLALLLFFAQMGLGAMRWRMILCALSETGKHVLLVLRALHLYYISVFFNTCLPGTVGGDVVRVWLAKTEHIALPIAIHSVIIDRVIALLALLVMVLIGLPFMADRIGISMGMVFAVLVPMTACGIWVLLHAGRLLAPYTHFKVVRGLLYFFDSVRMLYTKPAMSPASLGYALVAHVSYCVCAFVLAHSMQAGLSFSDALLLMPVVLFMTTLPLAIGGWGMRELTTVGVLTLVGVPQAQAALIGIEIGLLNMVGSLPAGLMWLAMRRRGSAANG